jgi:hypothetical protein
MRSRTLFFPVMKSWSFPCNYQTQYFKVDESSVHLSVVSRLDVKEFISARTRVAISTTWSLHRHF